jgi:hypothetical protein
VDLSADRRYEAQELHGDGRRPVFFQAIGEHLGKRSLLMIKSTLRRSIRRA